MKKVGLFLGPTIFCLVAFLAPVDPQNPKTTVMAGIALLMATWWLTEAVPLFATALIPLILYPVLGIERGANIAPIYFNSTIVLYTIVQCPTVQLYCTVHKSANCSTVLYSNAPCRKLFWTFSTVMYCLFVVFHCNLQDPSHRISHIDNSTSA